MYSHKKISSALKFVKIVNFYKFKKNVKRIAPSGTDSAIVLLAGDDYQFLAFQTPAGGAGKQRFAIFKLNHEPQLQLFLFRDFGDFKGGGKGG